MVFNVVSAEFIVVNVEFIVVSAVLRGVSISSMSGVVVGGKNALVTCHINLLPWPIPARVHNGSGAAKQSSKCFKVGYFRL